MRKPLRDSNGWGINHWSSLSRLYAPYAFEEAIGYMFGDIVRDKDGIAAAIVFLSLAKESIRP